MRELRYLVSQVTLSHCDSVIQLPASQYDPDVWVVTGPHVRKPHHPGDPLLDLPDGHLGVQGDGGSLPAVGVLPSGLDNHADVVCWTATQICSQFRADFRENLKKIFKKTQAK